jgi:putative effector of murein hydrolase LrgA (UPF0299 family)
MVLPVDGSIIGLLLVLAAFGLFVICLFAFKFDAM